MNKYKIALVQLNLDGNRQTNTAKCVEYITEAARKGANVICLPELYSSFYFCQSENIDYFDFAEEVENGPSYQTFSKLAAQLGCAIVVPFFEKRSTAVYHNSAMILDADGSMAGFYRKMHIPDDPCFYEKFYFTPGDLGYKAHNTKFGRIGVLICWDQWFPEAARLTAMQGPDVLFYPTAVGWLPSEEGEDGNRQRDSWIAVQRGHAVANGIFVAAVNRVGFEKHEEHSEGICFWGSSFVAGPQGEIIAQASLNKEEIVYADIDLNQMETVRRIWPYFRDRRTDSYGGITQIWGQK
ncbi:MAG: carbon-nitrogen hydrolase [Bacteroidales bacterium]|nr:carbon-nitrogen hydrolase [Bacteroidales bacterium]